MLKNGNILKKEDPKKSYQMFKSQQKELGQGAYASVSQVARIADGKQFAMKLIKYKELKLTSKEQENMITEVGILQIHPSANICRCIEAYDFKDCVFLILELMSKNLTALMEE